MRTSHPIEGHAKGCSVVEWVNGLNVDNAGRASKSFCNFVRFEDNVRSSSSSASYLRAIICMAGYIYHTALYICADVMK